MDNIGTSSFLTFSVNDEVLAIDVHSVIEVKDAQKLTNLPMKIKLVMGLMMFRDEYLPVIDCREKFGYPKVDEGAKQVYIIVEFKGDNGIIRLAFTADKVLGVVSIDDKTITDMPEMGVNNVDYVKGIVKVQDNSVIILDIKKVFSIDEIMLLEKVKLETLSE